MQNFEQYKVDNEELFNFKDKTIKICPESNNFNNVFLIDEKTGEIKSTNCREKIEELYT